MDLQVLNCLLLDPTSELPALAILHLFTKFSLIPIYFLFGSSFLALINVKTLPGIANMYTVNMDENLFRGLLNTANKITFVTQKLSRLERNITKLMVLV